jgi:hypothetical protein
MKNFAMSTSKLLTEAMLNSMKRTYWLMRNFVMSASRLLSEAMGNSMKKMHCSRKGLDEWKND